MKLADEAVDDLLRLFNGGIVRVPDENNPCGFTAYYKPREAMRKVIAALSTDRAPADVEGLVERLFAELGKRHVYFSQPYRGHLIDSLRAALSKYGHGSAGTESAE